MPKLLLLVLFCFGSFIVKANEQYVVVNDLESSWRVLDVNADLLQPFNSEIGAHALYFNLELSTYKRYELQLSLPIAHSVYLDGQLMYYTTQAETLTWSIDSLMDRYTAPNVLVSIYSENLNPKNVFSHIVKKQEYVKEVESYFSWDRRDLTNSKNLIIFSSLFVLAIIVLFRASSYRLFREYMSLSKSTKVRQRFDLIAAYGPWSPITLSFVFLYAVLVAGSALNLVLIFDFSFESSWFLLMSKSPVVLGVQIFVMAFVLMALKYPLILILSRVFNFLKFIEIHFYSYLRFSLLCAIIAFGMTIVLFVIPDDLTLFTWLFFRILLAILLISRVILMFLVLNNNYNFRKIHLFSYLCSAEIIPLVIVIKNLLQ